MARNIFGSQNITDTASAIQLFGAVERPVVFAVEWRARAGNNEAVYLGTDSAAKSSGLELLPGDVKHSVYHPLGVKASNFWVWGADSGDKLDWEVLRED